MELQTVVFYGKAGAGKGTQAQLLKKYLEEKDPEHPVLYIETGAAFREFAKQNSFTAQMVKKVLETGGLLPVFLPVWIWTDIFIKYITGREHIILDGLARNSDEVPVLARALQFYARTHPQVVLLTITEDEAIQRLKGRSRADDTEQEIKKRLAWFDKNVLPAVESWRQFPEVTVHEINSQGSIEDGREKVFTALKLS